MIKGERVALREILLEDLDLVYRWVNDSENTEWLLIEPPISYESERMWIERARSSPDRKVFIIIASGDKPIGTLSIEAINWRHLSAQVGISIFEPDYRGKGLGTEAMNLALKYAFEVLRLHRVQLYVFENNERAIRSYKKCGFQTEGLVRECYYKRGRFISAYLMSILADEWKRRCASNANECEKKAYCSLNEGRSVSEKT